MYRTKIAIAAVLISLSAVLLAWAAANPDEAKNGNARGPGFAIHGNPRHHHLERARKSFDGDLRKLPFVRPQKKERPEREAPAVVRRPLPNGNAPTSTALPDTGANTLAPSGPAPPTSANFDGLDFDTFGNGHPPDTNGDVGPQYYIQTVNTSIGIFRKTDGVRVAAFSFNDFMSQGNFGNLCDTNNFGDPVVVYDSFEDRWIITDFAFKLDGSGNVVNPPGSFQCFAASKSGDPVNGGWNFYSINTTGGLGDYPKFGIWPDGLYMSVNMFDYSAGPDFQNVRVYAFNKAQMYAGSPTVESISFDAPPDEFTMLPGNARLQAGTPPSGRPNYFSVVWQFNDAISFYKFHVDWTRLSLSTFTGPFTATAPTRWVEPPSDVPEEAGNTLDTLPDRLMAQNQYSNLNGVESLWNVHTIQGGTALQSAVRYYQVTVTGGTVAATTTQAATHNPSAALNRFMPSVAVDRAGNMALGYSTSSSTAFPAINYAGRLSTDAANAITQTEASLIDGTGSQSGSCGGTCHRWGDYSAMSLDPDGCTFWYTSEYYATTGLNDLTRIGAFKFSQCTSAGSGGTLSGLVTATSGGSPINGATVALGSRTATTNASGAYSFSVPAGTYPTLTVSAPGYISASTSSVAMSDNNTTTKNFALDAAPAGACFVDTTQSDFQTGGGTDADFATSAGDVVLSQIAPNTYSSSGSFVSSTKDANPAIGKTSHWTTLSWNAATPAGATVKFQVAASNNPNGPFNFVGPDGTAATYFVTSGASIGQFSGSRYLQYKAYLSTTNTAVTPSLHDVTLCFSDGTPQIVVEQPAGTGLTSGTSTVDFGTVNPGTTSSRTFTIRDTGNGSLAGIAATFEGTNAQDFVVSASPATLVAPSGSTTFTVQFNPLAAGARSAVMHIASNDPTTSPFDVNLTGIRRTYSEAWRLQFFNTTDNLGDAADTSDPEHDGSSNLVEFGTGSDPTKGNAMPGKVTINGSNLEFRYQRSKGAMTDGVLFQVEWSDDLSSLIWNTTGVTESIESQNSLFQQVKALVPKGSGNHRFLRLRVTRP